MVELKKTCFKCGQEKNTIKHHLKYNILDDQIVDCCLSCHRKIHLKVRKNNMCPYSPATVNQLSQKSANKRRKSIFFGETLVPNVRLHEKIIVTDSGHVGYSARFQANHKGKLVYINCD